MSRSNWMAQFARFGVVGLLSNAGLYVAYLLLALVMPPVAAMTVTYGIGVAMTFLANRRWTFAHRASAGAALRRYVIVYLAGYGLNAMVLLWLTRLGWPHQLVQAGLVAPIAVLLFLAQRYWVFVGAPQHGRGAAVCAASWRQP